jgi:hypothetical protein
LWCWNNDPPFACNYEGGQSYSHGIPSPDIDQLFRTYTSGVTPAPGPTWGAIKSVYR